MNLQKGNIAIAINLTKSLADELRKMEKSEPENYYYPLYKEDAKIFLDALNVVLQTVI